MNPTRLKPTRRQLLAAIVAAPVVGCAAVVAAARPVQLDRSLCRWPFESRRCEYNKYARGGVVPFVPLLPTHACFHFEVGKPVRVVYFDARYRPVDLPHVLLARARFESP